MSTAGRRILALDVGEARIGLALSDPLGITAQPAGLVARTGMARDVEAIRSRVREHAVTRIVVGHPILLSGRAGARAEATREFAQRLERALPGVAVELWDERLTTAEAERILLADNVRRRRRREVIDSLAAVLILQSWMDAHATVSGEGGGRGEGAQSPT